MHYAEKSQSSYKSPAGLRSKGAPPRGVPIYGFTGFERSGF